jgi:peptidoglycan/xylan/chitin deacetylase (PgdA/CDA1 family)
MNKSRSRAAYGVMAATLIALLCVRPGVAKSTSATAAPQEPVQRQVVITIDDVPGAIPYNDYDVGTLANVEKINRAITKALNAHHAWAIGFVNERKVQVKGERDARAAMLQLWLDSGLSLGNHTYTHLDFNDSSVMKYEDDTVRGDSITRPMMAAAGQIEKYFRHPYLDTGPTLESKTAFEQFLKDRSYVIAPVTVEDADYLFNDVLAYAREKKDRKLEEKAREAYFDYFDASFDYEEAAARSLFGREIPQVLLLHDDELNAENLSALLDRLERRGYKFVTLDEALADRAYETSNLYVGSAGISWLERWRLAFGQKIEPNSGPEPADWAQKIFEQVRHNQLN